MLRDAFYFGDKPNVHPREKFAKDLADARNQSTTEHFWIINEYCDYRGFEWDFDFEFLPDEDVWAEYHNNVWPSQHQKDSGTWLCPKEHSDVVVYRNDVNPVKRKNIKTSNWVLLDKIDESKFDFSWHPDPTDPPYIYKWGCKFFPAQIKHVLEYRAENANQVKYLQEVVELLSNDCWVEYYLVDKEHFDFTWRPNPLDPPFIYVWGNKYVDGKTAPTIEYHAQGATERKYLPELVQLLPQPNKFQHLENSSGIDYSWIPDPTAPPYIYAWGNQWNKPEDKISIQYAINGATEYKYMEERAIRKPCMDNWVVPDRIDTTDFDFSWEPSPADPPFIYEFGTQHQKTGGPRYVVKGATEYKYIDFQKAKALPTKDNWVIPSNIDVTEFDFSWHPDNTDPLYIYQFGTQWALSGGPKYVMPGATEVKYMDNMTARALPNRDNWEIPAFIDEESFDFSWHPYAEDEPYIYQFGTQHQKTGGPRYITPGVHKNSAVKYIDTRILKAKRLPSKKNFAILNNCKIKDFDYSWHPDTTEEPYIYVFGNQWYDGVTMPTVEYIVPSAKQIKYIESVKATLDADMNNWEVPDNIDVSDFDFSWKPNPKDPAYIYQFGTQWQKTHGPRYIVPDAKDVKYIDIQKAKALPSKKNWVLPDKIQIDDFDYSWHPDATEQPYTYQFGTQWQLTGGPKYVSPESVGIKYIDPSELHAKAAVTMSCWEIPSDIDRNSFDFSWHPHPDDPDFIYQFGTQHQKTGGPKFIPNVPDSEMLPTKYIDTRILKAKRLPSKTHWEIPADISTTKFDFSWHPDDTDPKYIIQFGTIMNENDGPQYVPPDNIGKVVYKLRVELKEDIQLVDVSKYYITTTLEDLVNQHKNETFWALRENIDYTNFDFTWRPQIVDISWESNYVHVFGSSESEITQTYFVNASSYLKGNRDFKFIETKQLDNSTLAGLFKKPSMFLVDRGNVEAQKRFEQLKARFPDIQKTRYLNTWVDTISRCINRSSTELCWILNSELDYTDFNFDYYPNPWQMKMVHVFGTQWSHWGTTFIVNRDSFVNDTKYIKIIEHLSNLNFVKDQDKRAKSTSCLYDFFVVDHGNKEMLKVFRTLQSKANDKSVTNVEYKGNYLDTFKEILKQVSDKKEHYIWVCSSLCDYINFDFTYICDPFAREQLHVFPSGTQKYGDTFLVNVNKLRELIENMTSLEDYDKINFNRHITTQRYPAPEIISDDDTHTSSLDIRFDYPYVVLTTEDNTDIEKIDYEPINLWSNETKNIVVTSSGGTRIVVPREAKEIVKKELYDYPHIIKSTRLAKSKPLDIVFLSNGEKCADENYEHLLNVTKGLNNRIVRVDGVNGRVSAYHAAAEASETPWMFTVFAKLKVSNKFDWNWQPDRLQVPKHYVFHAKNPVNNLVYGHQAMIAYNKKMTLKNQGKGLDFTQDDLHEVLSINSGIATFNTDEWTTWRTSFRECVKLCTFADEISHERLKTWTTVANGDFAQYCLDGANDAVNYFDEVAGDFDKLKLSYDWAWLLERFNERYK